MTDSFEQVRRQIHEIRNVIGPVNLKLASMEENVSLAESKLTAAVYKLEQQGSKISELEYRINRLERRNAENPPHGRARV